MNGVLRLRMNFASLVHAPLRMTGVGEEMLSIVPEVHFQVKWLIGWAI